MAPSSKSLESTATLLARIRGGDAAARDRLFARIRKPLLRFAHGRLPPRARDLTDTQDLVQVAMLRALDHIEEFDSRREGAFLAYVRSIVFNLIRDEARRAGRRPESEEMTDDLPSRGASPLEEAVGREAMERYDGALARLTEEQREAVILRVEMGYTYPEIAEAMGLTSANSVRMMVTRAIARLGDLMQRHEIDVRRESQVGHDRSG